MTSLDKSVVDDIYPTHFRSDAQKLHDELDALLENMPDDTDDPSLELVPPRNGESEKTLGFVDNFSMHKPAATQAELVEALSRLVARFDADPSKDYRPISREFLSLNMEQNRQSLVAPAFRRMPRLKRTSASKILLLQHRIIIDLHWLYCRKESVGVDVEFLELAALLDTSTPFDLESAHRIASRHWSSEFRANHALTLTACQEYEMCVMRSPLTWERFKQLEQRVSSEDGKSKMSPLTRAQRDIINWKQREPRIDVTEYVALFKVDWLLGNRSTYAQRAKLLGLIIGKTDVCERTTQDKLVKLRKVLAA